MTYASSSKGKLVDVDGRLQTCQWDDDAGKRQWIRLPHGGAISAPTSATSELPG